MSSFSVFVFVFCFSLQQLGMESRARSSESLLNLDSYLPRFHRPLYGKYVGPGKVSLEADYLILCRPPLSRGGRRDPEGGSVTLREAHWLSRLPTRECARKPPQYKENSLPRQTPTHSQVLFKRSQFLLIKNCFVRWVLLLRTLPGQSFTLLLEIQSVEELFILQSVG